MISGEKDYFSELLLNILSTMSSFEKSMIKTRQMEGIRVTQMISPEKYSGRKQNTKESTLKVPSETFQGGILFRERNERSRGI